MSAGPRNYLTPTEPNENKSGLQLVKRGEGAASVWGVSSNRFGPTCMNVLGVIFLLISLGAPTAMVLARFVGLDTGGLFWGCFVTAHLFMIGAEMVTLRELPTRKWGMLACWGTFVSWIVVLAMS